MTPSFLAPAQLRQELRRVGLSAGSIEAAWPQWWSEDAVGSPAAEAELRFSLARKLGLSASSLLRDEPTFVFRGHSSFKRASMKDQIEELSISAVAQSLGRLVANATLAPVRELPSAKEARSALLRSNPYISLGALLTLCWSCGIPVVYQAVFPLTAKRMDAMTVLVGDRPVILLARRTQFPAFLSFMIAHELGHIALNHLQGDDALADFSSGQLQLGPTTGAGLSFDDDETAANAYALDLMTGRSDFEVVSSQSDFNPAQVSDAALRASREYAIDPGFVALALARSTDQWASVTASLKALGLTDEKLFEQVNEIALRELDESQLSSDNWDYVLRALGVELATR